MPRMFSEATLYPPLTSPSTGLPPDKQISGRQPATKRISLRSATNKFQLSGETRVPPAATEALPNFVSSLSKYFRVEDHHRMLESIYHDTREEEVRKRFDENLYVTGKQRYMTVRDGVVRRDRLIDLIHEEGSFTERVKMVMYFLFLFRDSRYRRFICEKVGVHDGKWDTAVFRETHTSYFKGVGDHTAFTNLRQFLIQTGILDDKSHVFRIHGLGADPSHSTSTASEIGSHE